jgi:hypothetical protein
MASWAKIASAGNEDEANHYCAGTAGGGLQKIGKLGEHGVDGS